MSNTQHTLQTIVARYHERFLARYGDQLNKEQWSAFNAITGCRQGQYGDIHTACSSCPYTNDLPRSCGHRSCNQCQYNSTQDWLERQLKKHLPVDYYMATFTLPSCLRPVAQQHRKTVYRLLLECTSRTLKSFGLNEKGFESELGMCAVLHTHTRRLDYHPHVHIVVPGGGVHRKRREWRTMKGKYLFNGRALATVFRALFLRALDEAGLAQYETPKKWVVQCKKVGRGKEALEYLSRYLYRGVITNGNIIDDNGTHITFRYTDSKTNKKEMRTLTGEDFIHLLLQHVLPKGFRRARDYGFLHGNAKAIMQVIQWILNVNIESKTDIKKKSRGLPPCPRCQSFMHVVGIRQPKIHPD